MVDAALRRSVEVTCGESLVLLPPQTRFILRGGHAALTTAGTRFGVPLPLTPCRASAVADRAALWLGPDEQLLLAGTADPVVLGEALGWSLSGFDYSLVEVSHRQCAFEASGPSVGALLNSGCPLDMDIRQFPVGMCTRTVFAKAEVVLWRTSESRFHIEVARSFAPYFTCLWNEAASQVSG